MPMARDNSTPVPSLAISFALKVLPPFRKVVKSLTKPSPSTTRPFLAILGQYLDEVGKCITQWHASGCPKGSSEEKQVLNLLTLLEEATKDTPDFQRKKPSTYSRSSYSNLEAIFRCLPLEKRNRAIKCIKNLGDIRGRSKSCREKLQAELENLGELTGDKSRECLSDLPTEGIKDADWAEHVQELHSILGEACACSSADDPRYIANVGLAPIEVKTSKDSVPFSLFISHLHGNKDTFWRWKETQISVILHNKSITDHSHISSEEFCKLTRERTLSNTVLRGTRGSLIKERDDSQSTMFVNEPSMSLGNLIFQKKLKDDDALRVKLSYLVAKAVWQFYDSHWMSEAWSKDTIHFMKEGNIADESILVYLQKPFITAKMGSGKQDSSTPCTSESETDDKSVSTCLHIYPKILSLGIILLEILRGEGIDRYRMQRYFRDDKGNLLKDADLVIAGLLMQLEKKGKPGKDEYSSNIRELLKEVIDFCIKGDVEKLGRNSKEVRANLRTHVVAPLYQLYSKSCPENYVPDPIELSLDSISKGASSSVSHNCRFGVSASITVSDQQRLELRQVQDPVPIQHGIGLHDKIANYNAADGELQVGGNEVQREEASHRLTDEWMERFQNLLIIHDIEARNGSNVIKVAIIDSGIDYNHLEVGRSRIRDSKSWIEDSDATVDKVGHGTYIAGIILQLTTNVELYIGKVTDTTEFMNRDLVTKAIKHARTEWKVNMISLSFGFDNPDTNENREIQTCIDQKIIIFSSASNDGGEGSRSYPAAYDRVICIHSATPQGIVTLGNPIFDVRRVEYSIGDVHLSRASNFLSLADEFYIDHINNLSNERKIRIAILDTGINEEDAFFRGHRYRRAGRDNPFKEKKSFVGAQNNYGDTFGHGTNVARLILEIAPEADLYIAKISKGQEEEGETPVAIEWALESNVDIINMSFAFPSDQTDIKKAIRNAENSGVIFFAAASNGGGHSGRMFPAKLDTVLCIHASDGDGNKSGMDPSPKLLSENFTTLGVAIPSDLEEGNCLTGTSYSTPIAVGIAANVLRFIEHMTKKELLTEEQHNEAFSRAGMKKILIAMSEDRDGYQFITPWRKMWDKESMPNEIVSKIKQALKE